MPFQNHEILKIQILYPVLSSFFLYFILFCFSIISIKKTDSEYILSKGVTEQIRGVAILLVMIGHIGVHVISHPNNFFSLGDYGVSIFFLLSGFGLTRSYQKKTLVLKGFVFNRVTRVLLPYWIVTAIIITMDFLILKKGYDIQTILLTLLGINVSLEAKHIDYVRWYITVLFIWYAIFFIYWKTISQNKIPIFFLITALFFFIFNYYVASLGYALFSFPCGVILGCYYDKISNLLLKTSEKALYVFSIGIILVSILLKNIIFSKLVAFIPSIILALGSEITWVTFTFGVLIFFHNSSSVVSNFLYLIGQISYEIFLLHAVFMIKYDFILYKGPLTLTFWPYFLFIVIICVLFNKILFNKMYKLIYDKKVIYSL